MLQSYNIKSVEERFFYYKSEFHCIFIAHII